MRRILAAVTAAVLLAVPMAVASPAAANGWNYYDTTLPEFVTGPTPFEVTVQGDTPVCSMLFDDVTLTAAPWVFTYKGDGNSDDRVRITTCDGYEDTVRIYARSPFNVTGKFVYKGDYGDNNTVSVYNRTDSPATITVTDSKGNVVTTTPLEANGDTDVTISTKGNKSTVVYTLTVTGENGMVQSERILAPKGWTPLMDQGAAFAPCSTVKWFYDPSGKGPNRNTMKSDIEGSLDILSKQTGLKFVYTDNRDDADLTFEWKNLGRGGVAGLGGYSWSSNGPSKGHVTFNSKNYWTTDKYKGFASGKRANGYGPAGRGWLVIHETMHALGFGHVENEKSIMAPVNKGQSKFNKGDLEGLQTLYPSTNCAA